MRYGWYEDWVSNMMHKEWMSQRVGKVECLLPNCGIPFLEGRSMMTFEEEVEQKQLIAEDIIDIYNGKYESYNKYLNEQMRLVNEYKCNKYGIFVTEELFNYITNKEKSV